MKMHFTKMLSVCCAIMIGAFFTTDIQAQGNTCETATGIDAGDYTADGPTDGVSSTICETSAGDFADWYSYTPATDGFITVSSCEGGVDTQLSIFSGTCDALVCEDSNDDFSGCADFASQVVNMPVVGGTTYYIQWDNDWEDSGFDWSLSFLETLVPDCEGEIGGSALPGTSCDDENSATFDDVYGEDCVCAGTPFDCEVLEANIGDSCNDEDSGTFDDIVGDDCVCAGTPYDCTELEANIGDSCDDEDPATVGDVVGADCGCAGVVPPGNGSTCETATAVSAGSHLADGPTDGVSSTICETSAGDFADWYSYTPAEDGFITVSSCEGGVDTQLSIFSGTCDALVCEDSNDDFSGCADFASQVVELPVVGGTTYYIQWDNDWSDDGFAWSLTFEVEDCNGVIGGPDVPGASCDDGNPDTENDVIGEDCGCAGTPILDCPALEANIGDACDDTDDSTENDTVTADCECVGTPVFDCPTLEANIGDACDDTDDSTENDTVTADCECVGEPVFDCPALEANIGDACDDTDDSTENDTVTADCECVGTPVCSPTAVDDASMTATFDEVSQTVELTWDAIPNSIACQVQGREVNTPDVYKTLIEGDEPSSYTVQPFRLDYGTTYEWRVRCACSLDPVVVGPWSSLQEFTTPSGSEITSSPNPTEGVSFVSFTVPVDGMITLEVFDMSGRSIDVLFSGNAQANNEYRFEFDGSNLPNGVYIYRLVTGMDIVNEKFMIAR